MRIFVPANILLPAAEDMAHWSVIAVDQFSAQPEYWQRVRQTVGSAPSTLHLVWPEAELSDDASTRIDSINRTMRRYLEAGVFRQYDNAFIYVERTLLSGKIRRGVVGAIDLEQYDYTPGSGSAVRATEKTVLERIPPRVNIRKDAVLELPHVLLLCNDPQQRLLDSLTDKKDRLPPVYDFDLMEGGGHIRGWLVQGPEAEAFCDALAAYEESAAQSVVYAVGDGNHSLAAAKACYEAKKATDPLSRYALVELENIHDDSQEFEPIHRIVTNTDPQALLEALKTAACTQGGYPLRWFHGSESGTVALRLAPGQLAVGALQSFLDTYLEDHPGETDYIHGDRELMDLSKNENTVGFLLPPMEKAALFPGIIADGVLPRKTFSMGHAQEKRYYLEARSIKTAL